MADVAVTSNYQDCVHGQLARFSEAYPEACQAIVWAAVDGLKSAQIAELIGRSAGATREFLSQTRKRLRHASHSGPTTTWLPTDLLRK